MAAEPCYWGRLGYRLDRANSTLCDEQFIDKVKNSQLRLTSAYVIDPPARFKGANRRSYQGGQVSVASRTVDGARERALSG